MIMVFYRQQIQEALNRQTYHQFRAYAQQQFVGDPVQVWSYFIFAGYYVLYRISKCIVTIGLDIFFIIRIYNLGMLQQFEFLLFS